ncbi:DMT family transporter [Mannheimia haemolytica]|uniref:DMT family transporter n=1 Tax=Mannheimia haemolytica TaxID=75985 RepID=UPI0031450451
MKQRPLLGFSLVLTAAMTWGTLPIAAQQVLKVIDAQTLVWVRFVVASVGLLLILGFAKRLPKLTACSKKELGLILLGVCGLSANFFLFAEALHYVSPTINQVLWQLAPFSMILLGVLLFKEKFGLFQKIGFVLLIAGLVAFFNDKFAEILQLNTYALGVLLSAGASLIWVLYGVAQKLLLAKFNSQQVLFIIYIGCSLLMLPFASPAQLGNLEDGFLWGCFIYCC